MFKLAYGAIGWDLPMSQVAEIISGLGYQGLEGFGLLELLPEDEQLAERLRDHRLSFVGSYFSGSFVQPDRLEHEIANFRDTCRRIRAFGGNKVAVGAGRIIPNQDREVLWQRLIPALIQLSQVAVSEGVVLCLHPHQGNLVYTEEETARVVAETPPTIMLTLDTAHLSASKCDVVKVFERFSDRLGHVHLKDYRNRFLPLGEGDVPLADVLNYLQSIKYEGWATVELDATHEPEVDARKSMDFLRKHLRF